MDFENTGFPGGHFDRPRVRVILQSGLLPEDISGFEVAKNYVLLIFVVDLNILLPHVIRRHKHPRLATVQHVYVIVLFVKLLKPETPTGLLLHPQNFVLLEHVAARLTEFRSESQQEFYLFLRG